jgi:hypothetical protein
LQRCFASASAELLAQGVCYPKELLSGNNGFTHTPVGIAVRRQREKQLRPVFEKLNAAGHSVVLLSSEQLSFLSGKQMAWLRDVIGVPDIDVVYTCRRWSGRVPSMWFQSLYKGEAHTLPEYYIKLLNGQAKRETVDYSLYWRQLAEVFGRDHVLLFPYSNIMDKGQDIFVKFCTDILRIQDVPKPALMGSKLWASFDTEETELLRMLNTMRVAEHGERDPKVYWQYKKLRKRTDVSFLTDAMADHLVRLRLDDTATVFDPFYARMDAFADRVAGGGPIFSRLVEHETYVDPGYLLGEGVVEQLKEIYARAGEMKVKVTDKE